MLSFYQCKSHKSSQIFHTRPLISQAKAFFAADLQAHPSAPSFTLFYTYIEKHQEACKNKNSTFLCLQVDPLRRVLPVVRGKKICKKISEAAPPVKILQCSNQPSGGEVCFRDHSSAPGLNLVSPTIRGFMNVANLFSGQEILEAGGDLSIGC